MLGALKKILGIAITNGSRNPTETRLFSGSAYFSNRVPTFFTEKWVANGGDIASGTTLDARARYFFAIDPSEPWVTKLFAKSVMVIHAGWIVHCVEENFQAPISDYILDEHFVPGPPYKLIVNVPLQVYVSSAEPTSPSEREPALVQTSDTPSTPTSMPRKRKREQAYFDSPTGSLVFSGFDKDGMPRRPRKLRKLRFDPSFSPAGGSYGKETMQPAAIHWLGDRGDDSDFGELAQDRGPDPTRGGTTAVRPQTPDRPFASGSPPPPAIHLHPSAGEYLQNPKRESSPTILVDKKEKMPPVRTIDFTNLPPPIRRRRFFAEARKDAADTGTKLSIVRATDDKVKTPKKISFASHARISVYDVSRGRRDVQFVVGIDPTRRSSPRALGDGPNANAVPVQDDETRGPDGSAAQATTDSAPRTDADPKISDDIPRLLDENLPENSDVFTTTQVQAMQRHLELATKNGGVDGGQLAAPFKLGGTYRGMEFRHVW